MIRGAIFDMDGTLTDSNPFWDKAPGAWLSSIGKKGKPGLARQIFAMTLPEAADFMTAEYGLTQTPQEIIDGINAEMERFYLNDVPLKKGAGELISMLNERGVKCAVASVTDRFLVEAVLKRFGLADMIGAVVTTAEVGVGKLKPDIYLRAAEKLGTKPRETLVLEDAAHALKTARNAGFPTVGVFDEASEDLQEEVRALSDIYMKDFSDLSEIEAKLK